MRRLRSCRPASAMLLLSLLGASAFAETTTEVKRDPKKAEMMFKAGEQAYRNGEFADGAQHFETAFEHLPLPEIAFSAAQAYRLAYERDPNPRYVSRAIELYDLYQKQVTKGPRVADALAHLGSLRKEWREIVAAGKATDDRMVFDKSQITVLVPDGAKAVQVRIDGKPVEALAYVDVAPGEHVVEVEATGYVKFTRKVNVAAGKPFPLSVELVAKPAQIKIASEDGILVAVDGRPVAPTRDGVIELPFGKRYITITRRGRQPFARELTLEPGATVKLDADLRPTDQRRVAKWVLIGGTVLLGVTAFTTSLAFIADGKASDQKTAGIMTAADIDTYNTWRSRRDGARMGTYFVGSATLVVGITALGLYLFDNPQAEAATSSGPEKRDEVKFTPMALGGSGEGFGVGLVGGW